MTQIFLHSQVTLGEDVWMQLDNMQRACVTEWIGQGAKLSEIQTRLSTELGLKLTYMEVRFLVDDLKLVPKDPEVVKEPEPAPAAPQTTKQPTAADEVEVLPRETAGAGSVSVTVDQVTRPGALISGKVTFSDGQKADWTLDQMGRLGLAAEQRGYRPSAMDVEQFQAELQGRLAKMGF